MIATVLDTGDLLEVVWVSLAAGIGVTAAFGLAIVGSTRAMELGRHGPPRRGHRVRCHRCAGDGRGDRGDRLRDRGADGQVGRRGSGDYRVRQPLELVLAAPGADRRPRVRGSREAAKHEALCSEPLDQSGRVGRLEGDQRAAGTGGHPHAALGEQRGKQGRQLRSALVDSADAGLLEHVESSERPLHLVVRGEARAESAGVRVQARVERVAGLLERVVARPGAASRATRSART